MKTTIFALALWAATSAASAKDSVGCELIGDLAEVIMEARQAGVPVSGVLKKVAGSAPQEKMVMLAWAVPMYQSEEYQQRAVQEFRERWELPCFRAEQKKGRK